MIKILLTYLNCLDWWTKRIFQIVFNELNIDTQYVHGDVLMNFRPWCVLDYAWKFKRRINIIDQQIVSKIVPIFNDKPWSWVITSGIPTGKGGGEKANYFIIIVHLLSSFIIGCHHPNLGFDSRRLHQISPPAKFGVLSLPVVSLPNPPVVSLPNPPKGIAQCMLFGNSYRNKFRACHKSTIFTS